MGVDKNIEWLIAITLQLKEMDEHKYFLSKELMRDIGVNAAVEDFSNYHGLRFREAFDENKEAVLDYCKKYCGNDCNCKGYHACPMPKEEMHLALKD